MLSIRDVVTKENIRRKNRSDWISQHLFMISAFISASFIVMIIGIIAIRGIVPFIQVYEGYNFREGFVDVGPVNLFRFITGMQWLDGAVGTSAGYGVGFVIINTLIAVFLAIILAVPIGVFSALFIAKIAPKRIANTMRTIVELLASVPSIIFGVFGLGVITRWVSSIGTAINFQTAAGLSLSSTVIVLAIMILPTITAIAETSIRAVDKNLVEGSLALGASDIQTYFKVVLTAAKSGIFAGIILGVGRALGEATAVAMVSGNLFSGIQLNPLGTTATLTSRMLLGQKETIGLDYDIRFSVGLVLMMVILLSNFTLRFMMKRIGGVHEQ